MPDYVNQYTRIPFRMPERLAHYASSSLRRENTGAPLSVTKRLLDDMTDICPSRWELRTLLGRQVKGIGASDFPNTDFASTVYRSLSDHIDKRLDLGLGCTGFGKLPVCTSLQQG